MSIGCRKCGGLLKPKGKVYKADGSPRYHRYKCASCNAVEYHPAEEREVKSWEWVEQEHKAGRLFVWHDGKKWEVE